MPSIARKNLLLDLPRLLVAQAGIMFAVSLVTIQTGLQSGFVRSSSLLIDKSKADIWVSSKHQVHIGLTLPIPFDRVSQAKNVAGVDRAEALIIDGSLWRNSKDELASVTLMGLQPDGQLFSPWNIVEGKATDLKQPYSIIADQTSLEGLGAKGIGDLGTINSLDAKIVGLTKGAKSIILGNLIFTSLDSANAYANPRANAKIPCELAPWEPDCVSEDDKSPPPPPKEISATDNISFVLVRAKPGVDLELLKQKLEAALPDTRAYTRAEIAKETQIYWQNRSGIGFILGIGSVVGIVVGVVVVGQILYSSVSDNIREFGTLKAIGASDWVIYGVIIEQALWMAILGYVPGMAICLAVANWTSATQAIMILVTPASALTVLGITVVMCVSSAIFAIQKVTRLDPAIVFKT